MATKPIPLVQFLSSHTAYQARLLAMQLRCSLPLVQDIYRIVGNFWGRKLSRILRFCGYSRKFSPWNLGVWCPLAWHKQAIRKSFLHENRIFHQFAKAFSLESFPLYGGSGFLSGPPLLGFGWMCWEFYFTCKSIQVFIKTLMTQ